MENLSFLDYILFASSIVSCLLIGLYFGWRDRRNHSTNTYFVGNRRMSVVAISLSAFVSSFSSISFVGMPNDTYFRGPGIWIAVLLGNIFECIPMSIVFVPIFHRLKLLNIYDYLDMRFNRTVKYIAVGVQVFYLLFYMAISIYAASVVVTTLFGMDVNVALAIVGGICVFYTTIGGVKSVVWTDVIQTIMIFLGFLFITIFAVREVGGISNVLLVTSQNGRQLTIDFRLSPALPYTFWSALISGPCIGLARSVCCQHVAQRYLSVKTTSQAIVTALVGQILSVISFLWLIFIGLVMFTFYADCDPFTVGVVQKFDQMLPYFIMDLFQNIPGLVGILVSAICSAAVSSVSSGINALSLISHKEVLYILRADLTPKQELIVTKILTGLCGILTLLVTFLVPRLGGILDVLLTWQGIFLGPILGAYVLGMFFRRVNAFSCLIGMTLSFTVSVTLKVGNMLYPNASSVLPPFSIDKCSATTQVITTQYSNLTSFVDETPLHDFSIWQISTFYYGAISTYLTIILALVISLFKKTSHFTTVDKRLLWSPTCHDDTPTCDEIEAGTCNISLIEVNPGNDCQQENKNQSVRSMGLRNSPTQCSA